MRQSNKVLAVRGSVVPVAGRPVTLHAELEDGSTLDGQSVIARAKGIRRVWITPSEIRPAAEALAAIANAEMVVIGPGSLYTSLLPPLLVPGIRDALATTRAPRLFVCNVATQVGETEGYTLSQHLDALDRHGLGDVIDAVLVNGNMHAREPANYPAAPVRVDVSLSDPRGPALFHARRRRRRQRSPPRLAQARRDHPRAARRARHPPPGDGRQGGMTWRWSATSSLRCGPSWRPSSRLAIAVAWPSAPDWERPLVAVPAPRGLVGWRSDSTMARVPPKASTGRRSPRTAGSPTCAA